MKEQNEDFPSILEAVFLVIGLFIAEYLISTILFDLRFLSGVNPRDIAGVVAVLGNGIVFSALLHYKRMSYRSLFHSSRNSIAATVATLTLPVLLVIPGLLMTVWTIQDVVQWVFPMSYGKQTTFDKMMSNGLTSVITVCILAPVLEEMLFRGIMLRSFLRQYRRPHAILASAILFGVAHLNIYQFPGAVLIGIFSGWLYERTRSLWPCILLHAAFNSAVMWMYVSLTTGGLDSTWEPSMFLWIAAFVLAFIGLSLLQRLLDSRRTAA